MTHQIKSKVFNDPIHGHIELSGLSVKIIDTPQFQRLRDISQLGGVYYVFPGASSHRFEHSLGVSYLAKKFIRILHKNQPELQITHADMLCVEIAGLVHDIGHGPYSHLYDSRFIPAIYNNHDFIHEHASIAIFDLLIKENNLYPEFELYGLNYGDIHFIKELMLGDKKECPIGFEWKGRGEKAFLYDIVANKRNGIDVDKFDYFARDCHILGISKSFDGKRLMKFARVFRVDRDKMNQHIVYDDISSCTTGINTLKDKLKLPPLEICFKSKEDWNVYELFHTRYTLHKRAYQHPVNSAVELMILQIFLLADPYLLFMGQDNKLYQMSQCINDMHAYWKLTDCVLKQIETSYSLELKPARDLLQRLRKRDLFRMTGELLLSPETHKKLNLPTNIMKAKEQIKLEMLAIAQKNSTNHANASVVLTADDFYCEIIKIGYGKGKLNPVDGPTAFYEKKIVDMDDAVSVQDTALKSLHPLQLQHNKWIVGVQPQDHVSRLTPKEFEETYVRVYCIYKHQIKTMGNIFNQWCKGHQLDQSFSPMKRARTMD